VRKDVKKKKTLGQQTPREKGYTREFLSYPDDWNYSQRIAAMKDKYKFHRSYTYQLSKSLGWKELLEERLIGIKEEAEKLKLENEIRTFKVDASFTDLSDLIKKNTSSALIISNGLLSHSQLMMDYYARQITRVIEEAGGIDSLQAEDRLKIESYDKKIEKYQQRVQFMLAPGQISVYLKTLGIYDEFSGTKEGDEFSVTPDTILRMLEEINVSNKAFRNPEAIDEMIRAVGREEALNVEVDGRIIAEVDMSERKKERFKKVEDDKSKKSVKH